MFIPRSRTLFATLGGAFLLASTLFISPAPAAAEADTPPTSWVDKDTGHRVWRLTEEPNSSGLYFNVNAITPDKKTVIYTAPDGIHGLDLATRKTWLILATTGQYEWAQIVIVGSKTNSIFITRREEGMDPTNPKVRLRSLCKVDVYSGEVTKLVDLPPGSATGIPNLCVNADETLVAGFYEDGPPDPESNYNPRDHKPSLGPDGKPLKGFLVQSANKEEMMDRRLNAHIPLVLFTINLQTGKQTAILRTTDWIDHFLFSPADPMLLMYAHEGHWNKVDRLWFIRADGTGNTLIHKRQMVDEINGHEFWNLDGKSIWYDLQTPSGRVYWLAHYDTETQRRTWYYLNSMDRSLHFNVTEGADLICADGSDPRLARGSLEVAWIKLFRPQVRKSDGINKPEFIQTGNLSMERLVNMEKHDYRLEPNVRFTPDKKMVLFTGNMFGPSYLFGVEVAKAAPEAK